MSNNELVVSLRIGGVLSGSFKTVLGTATQTLDRLGTTTERLTQRQQRLGEIMSRAMQRPGRDVGALHRQYQRLGEVIEEVRRRQEKLAASMNRGQQLRDQRGALKASASEALIGSTVAALPVIGAVKIAAEFQDKLKEISVTGGYDSKQEARLGEIIRKSALLGNQTQKDMAEGIGVLVSKGIDSMAELGQYAPKLAKVATGTRASMEDLGAMAFTLRTSLGVTAEGFDRSMNILASAGNAGSFELKDMAKALPTIAPMFASLGVTGEKAIAEIGSALQISAIGAGSNSEAANNFQQFMAHLTSNDTINRFMNLA